jgi:hypothetical protein
MPGSTIWHRLAEKTDRTHSLARSVGNWLPIGLAKLFHQALPGRPAHRKIEPTLSEALRQDCLSALVPAAEKEDVPEGMPGRAAH